MSEVTIKVNTNGCYVIRGPIKLINANGDEFPVDSETIALCRCGGSSTKPFCDGSHKRNGFVGDEAGTVLPA